VLAFVVVLLTGTRGAALAIPAMIAVYAGFLLASRESRPQLLVLAALGLALAGAVVLSGRMGSIVSVIGEVLSTGSAGADSATSERLAMLGAAFEAFKASPWIGYGWANFGPAAAPFMDMAPHGGPTAPGFQFHNDLANLAVAAGSVGILCWVALLAAPIIGALATPRDSLFRVRLYCCLQLSVGYAIFGLTDFTFGYDLPTTLYAFLAAVVLAAFRDESAAAG
jgi:O-antigen ligase